MASGATVKLGVEGISQFKNNMNQAKQAVKTLDAQLSLSEKQFKQTGDAESYMTEKTELLKAKLEQQKTVVDNAQKALDDMASRGVDRASKAYQDMYRQMVTAKGALIDTENQLNGVSTSAEEAGNEVSGMNQQLANIEKSIDFDKVARGFGTITDNIEKYAKKAINFGKQIASTMIEAGSWADDLQTRAANYQITPEELQRMQYTAELIDTSVGSIVNAQKYLRKGLGKQDELVMGGLVEILGEGYDPRGKDWEDVFWDAGEALMRFTNAEEKEVYAQKLFGRSWEELIPLFTAGRKEYEEMNASWTVVSQESIDKLQSMDDEYHKMMANWETFKYEALAQFAEPMSQAFQAAQSALGKFMDYLKSDEGQALIDNAVNSLKKAIEWISDPENINRAIDALKTIIAGWGILKLTGGGLQVLNLINGAKGLFGGGKGKSGGVETGATGGSSGGWFTGAMNGLTGLASKGSAFVLSNGLNNLFPVVGDMFMNQTNAGRALRDGGGLAGLWAGLKQDVTEKAAEIKHNAETFQDDWANNVLVKTAEEINRKNQIAADWTMGDEYSAEELMAMVKAAEDLTGASETTRKSSSEMTEAAGTMKGLPGVIESAILNGMGKIKIYIDGQQAGGVLTPYVNNVMAGVLTGIVKP